MPETVYLDYNATTPVDPSVLDQMLPYFTEKFGNAASNTHPAGWLAKDVVITANEQVCSLLNADPSEIIFTSGATESVNQAIKGVYRIYRRKGNHIITCKTEHNAVLDTCRRLEKEEGARITLLDTDSSGLIDLDQLKHHISDQTLLVCIMYVNNETGVIQPMAEIAEIVHASNSILLSDATQAVGKIPIDLAEDRIDLMAFSAHKFYGPKGVGGLYSRRRDPRVVLEPLIDGGGHQRGLRSGTLNVPGIVGLGTACELARSEMNNNSIRIGKLRDRLESALLELDGSRLNGSPENRLYNTSNICFSGCRSEDIIAGIKMKLAVSAGSACTSEKQEPSHVLQAMGLSPEDSFSSLRFSLGKFTTPNEIDAAIDIVSSRIKELKQGQVN